MSIKIVADSGCDILQLANAPYSCAPLKIFTAEREYIDDKAADRDEMVEYLKTYKDKSGSSCPSVGEWLEAFGDSEEIICVTLTSGLSGSYNSACVAKDRYLEQYPNRKVAVVDSLSAGPGIGILVRKLEELADLGISFDDAVKAIKGYQKNTELVFMIKSLRNLAANGRVKQSVAMLASVLGICLTCKVSTEGTLEPMKKVRGEKNSLREIYSYMKNAGYDGGRVLINHCQNETGALQLKSDILNDFPQAEIIISDTRLLCSYYAEQGGVLVGFEK